MRHEDEPELNEIIRTAEHEFPEDPALQQIHIARGIIARDAKNSGMSLAEYIRSELRKVDNTKKSA